MSFDNHVYPNRKDWIKPYRKSKAFDRTCRCHGSCGYCQNNRMYQVNKERAKAEYSVKEWRTEIGSDV